MSLSLAFFGGLLVALIAIQMVRPRFVRRAISAARFFAKLPPPKSQARLAWQPPRPTRSFWLRLAAWTAAVVALLAMERARVVPRVDRLGVWLWIDTSASLTAREGGGTRWAEAQAAALAWLDRLSAQYPTARIEWRLSAFDEARRDLAVGTGRAPELRAALLALSPRALGTNVGLIAAAGAGAPVLASGDSVTHLIVISDLPRPGGLKETAVPIVWHEVGGAASNTGFTGLAAVRNPFTGSLARMRVVLQHAGRLEDAPSSLLVRPPGGVEIKRTDLAWRADGLGEIEIAVDAPGLYHVKLEAGAGGACAFDDAVAWRVPPPRTVRVDWRAPGKEWVSHLGWEQVAIDAPDLRVISLAQLDRVPVDRIPLLVLTEAEPASGPELISGFVEGHPLLDEMNFDVLERVGPRSLPLSPGGQFQFVLRAGPNRGWVAVRSSPRACIVPEPPPPGAADGAAVRLRQTLFFNALRFLLAEKPLPPLYTLTTPARPEPALDQAHLALHGGEGQTFKTVPLAPADPFDPVVAAASVEREPRWPCWVAVVAAIAAWEGVLALWGGVRWS